MSNYHNLSAEQYIIGAVLLDNSTLDTIISQMSVTDCYSDDHKAILTAALKIRSSGNPIDIITLSAEAPKLPSGEDTLWLCSNIQKNAYSTAALANHCSNVVEMASRRAYRLALSNLSHEADQGSGSVAELTTEALSAIQKIAEPKQNSVTKLSDHSKTVVDGIIERLESGGRYSGLLTGWTDLDNIVRGLRGGFYTVIAGRPGTGKTTLAMNIVEHCVKQGLPALVFSMEMPAAELATRMLSSMGRVPGSLIDTGQVTDHIAAITAWKHKVEELPLMVCDRGGMTIAEIRAISRFQVKYAGVRIIALDYLQLVKATGGKGYNRANDVGEISREVKAMAKELDVPVLVLSQLNRNIESGATERDPRMSDLKESGDIEQDADIIMFIGKTQEDGVSKITVAKHRHAPIGDCYLLHRGEYSRFEAMAKGYEPKQEPKGKLDRWV